MVRQGGSAPGETIRVKSVSIGAQTDENPLHVRPVQFVCRAIDTSQIFEKPVKTRKVCSGCVTRQGASHSSCGGGLLGPAPEACVAPPLTREKQWNDGYF